MATEGFSSSDSPPGAATDVNDRPRPGLADTLGIITLAAFTAVAIVSVTLAWTGHLRSEPLFPAWALGTLGLLALARPLGWRPSRPHPATVVAAVVIILVTALNVVSSGAHVTTDRDPGVYVVAGRSLARTGTTTAPGVAATPFATLPEARAGSAAYADVNHDGKEVELLPSPGLPALLATAQLAAGDGAMFLLMPLMAAVALAFFAALAMRIAGPWFGLVATAGLCASLAEAYIARDAFAEVPTQALVMGGFWLLLQALDSGRPMRALVAGAAIGATVAIHFPALVVVASLVVAAALESALGSTAPDGQRRNRVYLAACVTALPLAAYGALGLRHWNHAYEHAHQAFILDFWALIAVGLGIWGVAVVFRRAGRLPSAGAAMRRWTGYVAAAGVALAAVYGLAIRPSVERAHDPVLIPAAVAGIQRAAGVAIEPDRSYAEQSMRWLVDYMGPVALVLGLAGLTWACVRAVRPAAFALRLTLPLGVIATAVYCLRPAAFPDQPWVIRRFAAEVIPVLLIFAAWLLGWIWQADWRATAVRRVAVAVGAVLVVAAPLAVLRPVARASAGHRNQDAIHALCAQIGPDAAVLFGGGPPGSQWYPDTIRAFCGVPTASADTPNPAALRRLAAAWARAGRQLVLVTTAPSALARWGVPTASGTTVEVDAQHGLEVAVNRPPAAYRPLRIRLSFAPVNS